MISVDVFIAMILGAMIFWIGLRVGHSFGYNECIGDYYEWKNGGGEDEGE